MDSPVEDRTPDTVPHNWVRAILSDPLYQRMIKNPDRKIPFILVEA